MGRNFIHSKQEKATNNVSSIRSKILLFNWARKIRERKRFQET